ncbi:hypothetical protein ACTQZS_12480 [Bilifractor sp. LCP19S3_H10]|uniref:hypothetical protein n=1 Tax=Bilifractor sp. LCP19S3_H10 TaxID=3438736 RepID=UPI003F91DE4F
MIKEIYRGSGMTELICIEGENENAVFEDHEQDSGRLFVPAADIDDRARAAVKGYYRGRGGVIFLFDHLLSCGRKPGG